MQQIEKAVQSQAGKVVGARTWGARDLHSFTIGFAYSQ
jgi:hypothetical protein